MTGRSRLVADGHIVVRLDGVPEKGRIRGVTCMVGSDGVHGSSLGKCRAIATPGVTTVLPLVLKVRVLCSVLGFAVEIRPDFPNVRFVVGPDASTVCTVSLTVPKSRFTVFAGQVDCVRGRLYAAREHAVLDFGAQAVAIALNLESDGVSRLITAQQTARS